MKPTEQQLSRATELATQHPSVKSLLEFYEFVTGNPVYESYVARMVTLNQWNENLSENPVDIISVQSISVSDQGLDEKEVAKKDKEVDRVLKYMEKQPTLLIGTDEIRSMLLPHEQEKLKTDKRLIEHIAI